MTPPLDRDELAARLMVALYTRADEAPAKNCAAWAVEGSDALLSALRPTDYAKPAPPIGCMRDEHIDALKRDGRFVLNGETILYEALAPKPAVASVEAPFLAPKGDAPDNAPVTYRFGDDVGVFRTGSSFKVAPLPVAAEAKRPTHVRVTRAPMAAWCVTVGKVYPVSRWSGDGPTVVADDGGVRFLARPNSNDTDSMGYPAWEPCDPPAPVAPEAKPAHARIGDIVRVTRLKGREWTYEVASVTPQGFAVNRAFCDNSRDESQYGEHPGDYEIVTKGPLWPATPVPPVDPVREAERAVVEAAEKWEAAGCQYPVLTRALDALRAARTAKGGV